jgi:hypothetical protein
LQTPVRLIAVRTPEQLWQATEGLIVGGAQDILLKDGSNHRTEFEHDPLTVTTTIPCRWISGRFHLHEMRVTLKGMASDANEDICAHEGTPPLRGHAKPRLTIRKH